jgi:hypothetical protein
MAIENKSEFKARCGGKSPDLADSCVMMLHGCRLGEEELVRIVRRKIMHLPLPASDENLSYILGPDEVLFVSDYNLHLSISVISGHSNPQQSNPSLHRH